MTLIQFGVSLLRSKRHSRIGRKIHKRITQADNIFKTYHKIRDGKLDLHDLMKKAHHREVEVLRSKVGSIAHRADRIVSVAETNFKNGQRLFEGDSGISANNLALPKADAGGITNN